MQTLVQQVKNAPFLVESFEKLSQNINARQIGTVHEIGLTAKNVIFLFARFTESQLGHRDRIDHLLVDLLME